MIEDSIRVLLESLIKISVGMFGLSGTLMGLIWGFTQFISRTREMSDYEITNFLRESSHIIRYLILLCLLFICVSLFSAAVFISEGLTFEIPYLGSITVFSVLLSLSICLFAIGFSFSVYIFYRIGRSIIYLSRRLR